MTHAVQPVMFWPLAWYYRAIRFAGGATMLAIVLIVLAQVVARYAFNSSIIWAEEMCRYLLLWQTFLVIGYAYQKGEFVAVEVLPDLLTPWLRFALKAVLAVPILIFLWFIMKNGYLYSQRFSNQIIPALDFIWNSLTGNRAAVSISYVYISVCVGSALLALHVIGGLIGDFIALRNGGSPTDEHQIHETRA